LSKKSRIKKTFKTADPERAELEAEIESGETSINDLSRILDYWVFDGVAKSY
jgi:hypothetical protein